MYKLPLYIRSRFLDIKEKLDNDKNYINKEKEMWIVTNTKFSKDAIKYSECANINLLAWNYPYKNAIKEWVEISNLHPITCLSTLSVSNKKELLSRNIVACREINKEILSKTTIHPRKYNSIIKEVNYLIN